MQKGIIEAVGLLSGFMMIIENNLFTLFEKHLECRQSIQVHTS